MELEELIEQKRGDDTVHGRAKIAKRTINNKIYDDPEDLETKECFGDEVPINHNAVDVTIRTSDEFDIPPTYVLDIEIHLSKL